MGLEREVLVTEFDKPVQRGCGIVIIYNPSYTIPKQLETGLPAVEGVWHRGQQGLGVALQTEHGLRKHVNRGTMEELFRSDLKSKFDGSGKTIWGFYHCIYGTSGGYGSENLQPIVVDTPQGQVAVIHNGQFVGEDFTINGTEREGASDTYLFTQMLAKSDGTIWDERVLKTLDNVKGAYSLAIGVEDKIFLARDPFGIRPLVLGKLGEGWMAASETLALDKVGVKIERAVKPGEVIRIDRNGLKVIREGKGPGNFCDFEWAYFSRPDSLWPTNANDNDPDHPENWLSFYLFRERCGEILAKEKPIKNIDFVVGVPDSGLPFASGFSYGLGVRTRPLILRDHYNADNIGRVFMEWGVHNVDRRATKKLSTVSDSRIWKDKIVAVCDDSKLRGTVSKVVTRVLFSLGVKEVHLRFGFPKVIFGCHLGVDLRGKEKEELIAARHNGDEVKIAQEIGATSVGYISPEGFIKARKESGIVIPDDPREIFLANEGCGGCVTGLYPINKEGVIYQASFQDKK